MHVVTIPVPAGQDGRRDDPKRPPPTLRRGVLVLNA